jgi:MFS superfamily sulfate permease-like transporter
MTLFARFKLPLLDIWAGAIAALVFYAEYVGYGASIGSKLPGLGQTGNALGTVMVFGAVLVCGIGSLFNRGVILSGTRSASTMVFVSWLDIASQWSDVSNRMSIVSAGTVVMLIVASALQLLGTHGWIRKKFASAPVALTKGFMYASAVSIMAGMVQKQLAGCIESNMPLTFMIFLGSVTIGVLLPWACEKSETSKPFAALGLPVAVIAAWASFAWLQSSFSTQGLSHCNTLGSSGLQWDSFVQHMPFSSNGSTAFNVAGQRVLVIAVLYGLLLGTVLLIESLTALESMNIGPDNAVGVVESDWPRQMRISAAVNLFSSLLGLAFSSFSTSRSKLLTQAGGSSRLASFSHGLSLIAIAVIALPWMAKIPVIAIGVALALVAIQMIDTKMVNIIWKPGYKADAAPESLRNVWWFWSVLVIGVWTGQSIWGFVVASGFFWIACTFRSSADSRLLD